MGHRLPYRYEGNPAKPRPTVDVELRFGENGYWAPTALIDTGAPITVFDHATGRALLVRWNHAGAEFDTIALMGTTHVVQYEYIDLCLQAEPTFHWTAKVGFLMTPSFVMPFQGLLGNDGFLDKWAVTFNKYYEYIYLQRPDEAVY